MRTTGRLAALPLLTVLLALPACTRTEDGFRIEGDEAAARAEEAGERTAEALGEAGRKIEDVAAEMEERVGPAAEDAAISAKVKAKLAADPEVAALHIDVDTLDHVVTLSGRVASTAVRDEAEKLARGTEGVRSVVNNLVVGSETAPGSPAAPTPGG